MKSGKNLLHFFVFNLIHRINMKWFSSRLKKSSHTRDVPYSKVELFIQKCKTLHMYFTGSPFLASEDGVLGGIIVLRCCRCGEDHSSGNLQALLGTFGAPTTAHSHFRDTVFVAVIYFSNTILIPY